VPKTRESGRPHRGPAHTYFIGLGSNRGDRERNLRDAWARLAARSVRGRLSRLYESEPMYVTDQPRFLNAVAHVVSGLEPMQMLDALNEIEKDLGRNRALEQRMGPRTLDLDILLCDNLVMDTARLTIPHPRMSERRFVLVPLLELEPELRDPRTAVRYAEMLPAASGGVYLYPPPVV